ncbi:sugar kinase [Arhodomonas sp. AD133]|uniref:sugar kinase n=1 Tax=Arhodomonas sp. AD133 TaxID=3415009 RepID=UPI003EBBE81F
MARDGAPRLLTAGELLVEFVAGDRGTHHRRVAPYLGPYPSGAPAIFIDQAARVGADAAIIGSVGGDAFGRVILDRLAADGVDCSLVEHCPSETTGVAFVAYNNDGSREFIFHFPRSAATAFSASPRVHAAIADHVPDYFHVSGSILGVEGVADQVMAIVRAVVAAGGAISLDPNVRPELLRSLESRRRFEELLALARVLFPSEEDIAALRPGMPMEEAIEAFIAAGVEAVVLTRGDAGCLYRDVAQRHELPAFDVDCIDPTGAGDCFSATFLTLFAQGWPAERALRYANAAGANAVTISGPMEGNSSLTGLEQRLNQQEPS